MTRLAAIWLLSLLAAALPSRPLAQGGERGNEAAVGLELDLLPVAVSAVAGEPGGALQVWGGRGRDRLRVVAARLAFPDALTDAPGHDRRLTVLATIYDRFFRDGFSGPWVGAGLEAWWTEVGTRATPERRQRLNPVATAGAGWVFPVWRGLYLNPWAAGHVVLGSRALELDGASWRLRRLEGEVSLKVGWARAL